MEVKNHINTTLATAKWWPRALNRGGRWIEVSNTTVYWQINRDFGKWPLNGGWPLNTWPLNRGLTVVVLFWTKYAVPRQIKPGILELTTSRGQRILCIVFIFVSCEEKGCYRIVSLGHQNFDCRSDCGLSLRMQGNYGRHRHSELSWERVVVSGLLILFTQLFCDLECRSRTNRM